MKREIWHLIIAILILSAGAFGQSGGTFEIKKSVIAGGGGTANGGSFFNCRYDRTTDNVSKYRREFLASKWFLGERSGRKHQRFNPF